jgi:small-conductance mechanosensitive channel
MRLYKRLILAGLLAIIGITLAGLELTRRTAPIAKSGPENSSAAAQPGVVDQQPLETAAALRPLVSTLQEQQLANNALQLADDEVDLAFSSALRDAATRKAPPTQETRELNQRINQDQAKVAADQAEIDRLKQVSQQGSKGASTALQQRLELVQAQLSLDQDELADAKEDLIRTGGDRQTALQRMLGEHEASHAALKSGESNLQPNAGSNSGSSALISRFRLWRSLTDKQSQLANAQEQARSSAVALARDHEALAQEIAQQRSQRQSGALPAQAAVASLRQASENTKTLAEFDKRIEDEQQLSQVYSRWGALAAAQRRASVHGVLESVLWVFLIVFVVYLIDHYVGRFYARVLPERKRLRSLRLVVQFAVQAVGLLLILFVIFGLPGQMTTVLGLAGAGLTVALKDFIVAFFGWFVLMGKNGIRVGDWVEINGIGGEVVEIGLLRTILLETGTWSDAGHPTGRKVAFVNSFAIEGHFFNFSTTGQWLWDELEVLVPAGEDPYPIVEAIQKMVAAETEESALLAEQEWKRVAQSQALHAFSATPAINMKPTNIGVSIEVRYITRAHERYELRSRLYKEVVQLLRSKNIPQPIEDSRNTTSIARLG